MVHDAAYIDHRGLGFVGKALAILVLAQVLTVRVSTCQNIANSDLLIECVQTTDLSAKTDWLSAVHAIDTVVHFAARVHVMHDTEADPLMVFRIVNVEGALNMARQAAAAEVKRFVF